MRITNITYRIHINASDSMQESFEASAILTEDDDQDAAADNLREWVSRQVGQESTVCRLRDEKIWLENEIKRLEASSSQAKKKWEDIEKFMKTVGVTYSGLQPDEIPF